MTFASLRKASRKLRGAFFIEGFVPRRFRRWIEFVSAFALLGIGMLFSSDMVPAYQAGFAAAFFLVLIIFIKLRMIDAYCLSRESGYDADVADFEVLSIIGSTDEKDIVRGFILHDLGELCLLRSGASRDTLEKYLGSERRPVSSADFDRSSAQLQEPISLSEYAKLIATLDPAFAAALESEHVSPDTLSSSAAWVSGMLSRERRAGTWWSREYLANGFRHRRSVAAKECVEPNECSVLEMLLVRAPRLEHHYRVFFTYPAIAAVAHQISCCVIGTIAPQKAYETLDDLCLAAIRSEERLITQASVAALFAKK